MLTPAKAAKIAGVSRSTISRAVKSGELAAVRGNDQQLAIHPDALKAWMAGRPDTDERRQRAIEADSRRQWSAQDVERLRAEIEELTTRHAKQMSELSEKYYAEITLRAGFEGTAKIEEKRADEAIAARIQLDAKFGEIQRREAENSRILEKLIRQNSDLIDAAQTAKVRAEELEKLVRDLSQRRRSLWSRLFGRG